jgi:sulfur-oxidizing protein SoxY
VNANRRRFFTACAGALLAPCAARPLRAEEKDMLTPAIREITGDAVLQAGRVKLDIPRIADNGNAVPLKLAIDSPMTADDYVKSVHLLSEKNPRTVMARFFFGPRSGRAVLQTRVRLNGSQRVVAIAVMSDGSFWSDTAEVEVTESACYDATGPT